MSSPWNPDQPDSLDALLRRSLKTRPEIEASNLADRAIAMSCAQVDAQWKAIRRHRAWTMGFGALAAAIVLIALGLGARQMAGRGDFSWFTTNSYSSDTTSTSSSSGSDSTSSTSTSTSLSAKEQAVWWGAGLLVCTIALMGLMSVLTSEGRSASWQMIRWA